MNIKNIAVLLYLFFMGFKAEILGQGVFFGYSDIIFDFPANARSLAMARADATIDDDVGNILGNPAGLGSIEQCQMSFNYVHLLLDSKYYNYFISLPLTFKRIGTIPLAIGGLAITHDKFELRDAANQNLGTFNFFEYAFIFAAAYKISSPLSKKSNERGETDKNLDINFGINMRLHHQSFSSSINSLYSHYKNPMGLSLDIGMIISYNIWENFSLKLAPVVSDINVNNQIDKGEKIFKLGFEVSYKKKVGKKKKKLIKVKKPDNKYSTYITSQDELGFRICPQVNKSEKFKNNPSFNLGAELWVNSENLRLALRCGINKNYERFVIGCGIGFPLVLWDKDIIVNVSFLPELGNENEDIIEEMRFSDMRWSLIIK